jgi:MFS family permease
MKAMTIPNPTWVYRLVTVTPRKTSAMMPSDGTLDCLTGTALSTQLPAHIDHAEGEQSFHQMHKGRLRGDRFAGRSNRFANDHPWRWSRATIFRSTFNVTRTPFSGADSTFYFVTFAAAQIPIGILLDRYGPRRIQSALLVVAATGSALFAVSNHFLGLLAGRALIGLGVAAALTAGLKALVLWFPRERVPLLNGLMVMLGALGAVTATLPADLLLAWIGWRGLFGLFAALSAACAVMVYVVVPEARPIANGTVSVGLRHSRQAALERPGRYRDSGRRNGCPRSTALIGQGWFSSSLSWRSR